MYLPQPHFHAKSQLSWEKPSLRTKQYYWMKKLLAVSGQEFGLYRYVTVLRARMFRSLMMIPVLMIKERNIRARNITL